MCGIAGHIQSKRYHPDINVLSAMLKNLEHRGPDHHKEFHPIPSVHLGYTRFSITDALGGSQPFFNEDKSIACFFNGEIYNWKEVEEWLVHRNHRLKTHCDTEVIPHIYEEYGLEFAKSLEGMFAIALLDRNHHTIILARDRVGEKPLYYSFHPHAFLFASTIPALLASGVVPKDVDHQSVAEFFTFRSVPLTNTIIKSVKKVAPGSVTVLDYHAWDLSHREYWMPEITQPVLTSEERAVEELTTLLLDSVRLRTATDSHLNVGASLSGGIDSSTITALAKKSLHNHSLHSFSVDVKDDPEDLGAIRRVVNKVRTKHHWINCERNDINVLPFIVSLMGEPVSAGMTIPSYQCYRAARRKNVRVLFSGDGSDELFAGYSGRLVMDGIVKRWSTLDAHTQTAYLKDRPVLKHKIHSALRNPTLSVLDRYVAWDDDNCFDLNVRNKVLEGTAVATIDPLTRIRTLEQLTTGAAHENAMLVLELKLRLEGFMLVILDRTSMSCPVECRSPYLDSQIVNFAFRLSPELKYAQGIEKYILRKTMERTRLLPSQILWRKKHPFSGPISTWVDWLPSTLESLLSPSILDQYGFVNSAFVSQMYNVYKKGRLDKTLRTHYSDLLFAVLVLTLWLEIFLQNRSPEEFIAHE